KVDCKIFALVRNIEKAEERFSYFKDSKKLIFKAYDILKPVCIDEPLDYIIHGASGTNPFQYASFPVEIMESNFIGLNHLLKLAKTKEAKLIFLSTCEVYGLNNSESIKENDYGYIDILTSRACYNEAKKASETLCKCYYDEYQVDVAIIRLSRVYGPTMKIEDNKAMSQFIKCGVSNQDIVLKSTGEQLFDYTYVSDVVLAIMYLMFHKNLELSYNFSNRDVLSLKNIAALIADNCGVKVVFELPSDLEKRGFSKSTNSLLDSSKFISEFGFKPTIKLNQGIQMTLDILKDIVK
ncbi:MAG: NAD-dependent epimerase/dehydratase family protein, partial [Anaeroplasmataceae bacterium]|nr:NAD-dependent epimerase/dehydratase family protein [Anaeroplasmataceae bacterium]